MKKVAQADIFSVVRGSSSFAILVDYGFFRNLVQLPMRGKPSEEKQADKTMLILESLPLLSDASCFQRLGNCSTQVQVLTPKKPVKQALLVLAMFFIVLLSTLYYLFAFKLGFPGKPVQLSFKDIRLSVEKPGVYETVELDIRLNGSVSNPFDENEVNVTSEIILPNGVKWNMPA
ncbi:MAG: hypothetical protein QXS04_02010, partial [Thermoproteota archaeon]